jgi:hypothetical protein
MELTDGDGRTSRLRYRWNRVRWANPNGHLAKAEPGTASPRSARSAALCPVTCAVSDGYSARILNERRVSARPVASARTRPVAGIAAQPGGCQRPRPAPGPRQSPGFGPPICCSRQRSADQLLATVSTSGQSRDRTGYVCTISAPDGRPALSAEVMLALPNALDSSVVTCAELRVERTSPYGAMHWISHPHPASALPGPGSPWMTCSGSLSQAGTPRQKCCSPACRTAGSRAARVRRAPARRRARTAASAERSRRPRGLGQQRPGSPHGNVSDYHYPDTPRTRRSAEPDPPGHGVHGRSLRVPQRHRLRHILAFAAPQVASR